ncbi:MAG TPA: DUF669 domain-containing protein [Clostridia bacterium]|nr:DUF669 domain-containing protein [Clostridia bacterium]
MPQISLDYDLENVSSEFTPLEPGTYYGRIESVELTKSQKTNKPMLKIVWIITEGEYEGRKLFDNVLLETEWKVKQYALLAGIPSGTELDTDDFKDCEAILHVIQKPNPQGGEGEMTNNIKKIEAIS